MSVQALATTDAAEVLYRLEDRVATITLNRPDKLNAWTPTMQEQLRAAVMRVHADDAVRLGRATVWEDAEDGDPVPFGLKMLLVDGEDSAITLRPNAGGALHLSFSLDGSFIGMIDAEGTVTFLPA